MTSDSTVAVFRVVYALVAVPAAVAAALAVTELACRTRWVHRQRPLAAYSSWHGRTHDHAKKPRDEGINGFAVFVVALFAFVTVAMLVSGAVIGLVAGA